MARGSHKSTTSRSSFPPTFDNAQQTKWWPFFFFFFVATLMSRWEWIMQRLSCLSSYEPAVFTESESHNARRFSASFVPKPEGHFFVTPGCRGWFENNVPRYWALSFAPPPPPMTRRKVSRPCLFGCLYREEKHQTRHQVPLNSCCVFSFWFSCAVQTEKKVACNVTVFGCYFSTNLGRQSCRKIQEACIRKRKKKINKMWIQTRLSAGKFEGFRHRLQISHKFGGCTCQSQQDTRKSFHAQTETGSQLCEFHEKGSENW